ncbi:hypothetical protein CZ809_03828 [Photobacterium piscicola]|jgi:hypothetical protein|uniref:Uncharacterized protein n=1 Tax=Photobacterium piscicola TaxID=1378299 RepID=A0A1T5I5I0_9GAMM|nr:MULTISPECIES: hypothetical protein [Photobacterium]SKC34216.1 hypothetical protein CZ809_03828 [Photobacterium piscicola]
MKFCAEIEVLQGDEYITYYVKGANKSMRDKAIDRLLEDGGEITFEKYWIE